jgi:sialic acid synthase SpsE
VIASLDQRVLVDAEHARQAIRDARASGADAVKLVRRTGGAPAAEVGRLGAPEGALRATVQDPQLSTEAFVRLVEEAGETSILVAPYDVDAARGVMQAPFGAWKVDPPLLTHLPLFEELVRDGRPIAVGVAGCTRAELDEAVARLPPDAVLVHTLPAQNGHGVLDVAHVVALQRYGRPVGYSDCGADISAALMAVALGVTLVEKPFDADARAPSDRFEQTNGDRGLTAVAFRGLVDQVRRLEGVLTGDGARDPLPEELDAIDQDRVSIVASRSIPRGTTINRDMLAFRAPGSGLSPRFVSVIEGQRTLYDIPEGAFLTFGVIEP